MLSRSAFRPRRQKAPRPAWKVAEAFKQWIRGRPCACEGRNPECDNQDIQAAHTGHKGSKGMGTKAADRYCIPLSEVCHRTQHLIGWQSFAAKFLRGAEPVVLSLRYWAAWPGRAKWEEKNG